VKVEPQFNQSEQAELKQQLMVQEGQTRGPKASKQASFSCGEEEHDTSLADVHGIQRERLRLLLITFLNGRENLRDDQSVRQIFLEPHHHGSRRFGVSPSDQPIALLARVPGQDVLGHQRQLLAQLHLQRHCQPAAEEILLQHVLFEALDGVWGEVGVETQRGYVTGQRVVFQECTPVFVCQVFHCIHRSLQYMPWPCCN